MIASLQCVMCKTVFFLLWVYHSCDKKKKQPKNKQIKHEKTTKPQNTVKLNKKVSRCSGVKQGELILTHIAELSSNGLILVVVEGRNIVSGWEMLVLV